eukprot:ANDGO_03831.mRNA.1 Lysine 6-dehydrogenase
MKRVAVLGLGKVGSLVGTLLHESQFAVTGIDSTAGLSSRFPFPVIIADLADVSKIPFSNVDAVVSCLPFYMNLPIAKEAHRAGISYFDLTEDVPTTQAIQELSATAKGVMAPQCGLAPGFIGIVGASLSRKFDKLRSIELKVGALPKHPRGTLGYAFNWSAEGVINEYINDCEVIRDSRRQTVPALEGLETVVVDGVQLEAASTSGGLGTMCETYSGKVQNLHYKTLRYPGHYDRMKFLLDELQMRYDRPTLSRILHNVLPPVDQDYVFVHAAVEGFRNGGLAREEFVRCYEPMVIAGNPWRAISWTTAAGVCGVMELIRDGKLPVSKGFLRQEDVPLESFLATKNGSYYRS